MKELTEALVHPDRLDLMEFDTQFIGLGVKAPALKGLCVRFSLDELEALHRCIGFCNPQTEQGLLKLKKWSLAAYEWAKKNPGEMEP